MRAGPDDETSIDALWTTFQEERAAREAQAAELERLKGEVIARRRDRSRLRARLEQVQQHRVARRRLLHGLGITAAGAATAGAVPLLDRPSPAVAAGGSGPSSGAAVKASLSGDPGYSYQMLAGLEFMPVDSSSGWLHAGNHLNISPAGNGVYYATLDLPQGATVERILVFLVNGYTNPAYLDFSRLSPSSDSRTRLFLMSVGQNPSMQIASLSGANTVVDNSQYYYVVTWYPSASDTSQVLYGARVDYIPAGGKVNPITPVRVLDTRNNTGGYSGEQGTGATLTLSLAGGNGIPIGATGVVGTLRSYAPTGPGYLTVYPGTGTPPTASNVNFYPNPSYPTSYAVADEVTVGLTNGQMSISIGGPTGGTTHVVFDVSGYIL